MIQSIHALGLAASVRQVVVGYGGCIDWRPIAPHASFLQSETYLDISEVFEMNTISTAAKL